MSYFLQSKHLLYNFTSIEFLSSFIPWIILFLVIYKLFKLWKYPTEIFTDLDRHIFNNKHLNIKKYYSSDEIYPPFPNVWYPIIMSKDLKPGQVKPLHAWEKDLVVFRTSSGKPIILDAFCGHQGAHLGIGGTVVGEQIRCPFHSWMFDEEGICKSVPTLEESKVPKVKIHKWNCVEMNHWVFVWYDEQGTDKPGWMPPKFSKLENAVYCGQSQFFLSSHIIDNYGNFFDKMHFEILHSVSGIVSNDQVLHRGMFYEMCKNIFRADYQQIADENIFERHNQDANQWPSIVLITTPVLFGYPLKFMKISGKLTFCPTVIYFHWTSPWWSNFNVYNTIACVPVSAMRWHIVNNFYHDKSSFVSKLFAKFYTIVALRNAIPEFIITNNKKFMKNPHLTKLDRLQAKYYRWFIDSFYSISKN